MLVGHLAEAEVDEIVVEIGIVAMGSAAGPPG